MTIAYYLKEAPAPFQEDRRGGLRCVADGGDGARPYLTIADQSGKVVCTLVPASHAGVNQAVWALDTYSAQSAQQTPRAGRGRGAHGTPAPAGDYTFTLHAGGKTYSQKARLISRAAADSSGGREVGENE